MSDSGTVTGVGETTDIDEDRRKFLLFATTATGVVGAGVALGPFIASWQPSERARALGAPITVDLSKLQVGQLITATWRKQVIYIVRRAPGMVDKLAAHDTMLKDPKSEKSDQPAYAKNEMRSRRADLLVLIGFCTHLGCLPKQFFMPAEPLLGADWPGGFRCPCHGSRFDLAGRVFNGSPASTNLRIPPYSFGNDTTLVVGLDNPSQGAA
jgi:ubiquinol-cytochrome c reductase iron-sulfur subunit